MRRSALLTWSLLLCTLCLPVAAHATPPAREHWPATRAGALASGWLGAFAAGEDSMRAFLTRDMAESSLKSRGVAARLARYREMREEYGRFQLERVVDSRSSALKAKLLDGQARSWEAEFTLEDAAPWKLRSVTLRGLASGGHGMFGGFHH